MRVEVRSILVQAIEDNHVGSVEDRAIAKLRLDNYIKLIIQCTSYSEFNHLCHEFIQEVARHRYDVRHSNFNSCKSAFIDLRSLWRNSTGDSQDDYRRATPF